MAEPAKADLRRIEDLHAGNERREKDLQRQGVGFDRVAILALQIQALKDLLIGDDEDARTEYELAYQERLAEALTMIEEQVGRTKLLAPPNGNGKMLKLPGHG